MGILADALRGCVAAPEFGSTSSAASALRTAFGEMVERVLASSEHFSSSNPPSRRTSTSFARLDWVDSIHTCSGNPPEEKPVVTVGNYLNVDSVEAVPSLSGNIQIEGSAKFDEMM